MGVCLSHTVWYAWLNACVSLLDVDSPLSCSIMFSINHACTYLPSPTLSPLLSPSQVGANNVWPALSLIDFDPQLQPAMAYAFGNHFVCRNADIAKKVHGVLTGGASGAGGAGWWGCCCYCGGVSVHVAAPVALLNVNHSHGYCTLY